MRKGGRANEGTANKQGEDSGIAGDGAAEEGEERERKRESE
jgi:hypothetical protein